jgi:hypothetical protein
MGASSVASSDGGGGGALDGMLVVEAPTEASTPTTPVAATHDDKKDLEEREDRHDKERENMQAELSSTPEESEEGVFYVDVDVDEGIT